MRLLFARDLGLEMVGKKKKKKASDQENLKITVVLHK